MIYGPQPRFWLDLVPLSTRTALRTSPLGDLGGSTELVEPLWLVMRASPGDPQPTLKCGLNAVGAQSGWKCAGTPVGLGFGRGNLEPHRGGDPDASPTPDKVQAQHINTCVPPPPVACPQLPPSPRPPRLLHQRFLHRCALFFQLPHPHAPKGFFINGFFIAARSFSNCPTPTPPKVSSSAVSSSPRALWTFEARVGAAGPVAVAVDT